MSAPVPPSAPAKIPAAPSGPGRLLLWALGWGVVTVFAFVQFVLSLDRIATWDFEGQATGGWVVFTPFIALGMTIAMLIRAATAGGRVRAYEQQYPEPVRRQAEEDYARAQHPGFFFVIAGIAGLPWLAGLVAVLVFLGDLLQNPRGLAMALMLLALVALAWIPALAAGIRTVRQRSRLG